MLQALFASMSHIIRQSYSAEASMIASVSSTQCLSRIHVRCPLSLYFVLYSCIFKSYMLHKFYLRMPWHSCCEAISDGGLSPPLILVCFSPLILVCFSPSIKVRVIYKKSWHTNFLVYQLFYYVLFRLSIYLQLIQAR